MTRTDNDGTWESTDDGRSWTLVEPSQAWQDARASVAAPPADPLATLVAALADAQTLEEVRDAAAGII